MRVITGSAKGHKLIAVPGKGTRPILDRVKESLFNILSPGIRGSTFLDLFAGTGGVGIEALSRGAKHAVFVDHAYKAIEIIYKNLEATKLRDQAQVIQDDAFRFMEHARSGLCFDYIYVAPPQYRSLWSKSLLALDDNSLLAEDGVIIAQIDPKEFEPLALSNLSLFDKRQYGNTLLLFYAVKANRDDKADKETP